MADMKGAYEKAISKSTYEGKSMKPGGGGRFAKGVSEIEAKGTPEKEAKSIMAIKGREKFGQAKMSKWSAEGKARVK